MPFSLFSVKEAGQGSPITVTMLVALLVCLIPTTMGALLSAIGIAGMDRMLQANVLAMSGRAVEAAPPHWATAYVSGQIAPGRWCTPSVTRRHSPSLGERTWRRRPGPFIGLPLDEADASDRFPTQDRAIREVSPKDLIEIAAPTGRSKY